MIDVIVQEAKDESKQKDFVVRVPHVHYYVARNWYPKMFLQ